MSPKKSSKKKSSSKKSSSKSGSSKSSSSKSSSSKSSSSSSSKSKASQIASIKKQAESIKKQVDSMVAKNKSSSSSSKTTSSSSSKTSSSSSKQDIIKDPVTGKQYIKNSSGTYVAYSGGSTSSPTPQAPAPAPTTPKTPAPTTTKQTSALDIITDPVTKKQYYRESPTGSYKPYSGAQTSAPAPATPTPPPTQPQVPAPEGGIDYTLHAGETFDQYNARIAAARGETPVEPIVPEPPVDEQTPPRLPGESITDYIQRLQTGADGEGTQPIVATSAAERFKEFQKELGLGEAPSLTDIFSKGDQRDLDLARRERDSIEAEMSTILNERLAIDEEMQKFAINAGEGTTEAGRIGAVSEAQRNANERLQVLNRREIVLETKLSNRNAVIQELTQNQRLEYTDAVTRYNQQFSQALQLYQMFDQQEDEVKQNAKANLDVYAQSIQAQIESGQIAPNQISAMQKAKIQELEIQAGLPVGSTLAVLSTLQAGEEKLYSGVDDYGNFVYISKEASGKINVKTASGAVPQIPPKGSTSDANTVTWDEFLRAAADARNDVTGGIRWNSAPPDPFAIFTDDEMEQLRAMYDQEYGGTKTTTKKKSSTASSDDWMTAPAF